MKFQLSRNRPKGPWPLPIIGNAWIMLTGDSPLEAMEEWITKHGYWKFCEFRNMGPDNMLMTSDLKIIKEGNNSDKLIYRNLTVDSGLEKLGMNHKGVLMNTNATTWKRHRGLILKAVNSGGFLQNASNVIEDLFNENVVPELNNYAESRKVLVMKQFFKTYFMKFQEKMVFTHSTSEERHNVADYVESFFEAFHFYAVVPPLLWPLFSSKTKRLDQSLARFFKYQRAEIISRLETFKKMSDEEKEKADDFILSVLKSNASLAEEESKEQKELGVEEIRSIVNDLYLGLNDTSINTLSMNFYYLSRHPEVQTRLHDEIQNFLAQKKKIGKENIHDLEFLNAVVMETFRRSPTVPMIGRSSKEDVMINGYALKSPNSIMNYIRVCHNDPDIWKSPETWNPDRFMGEALRENSQKIFPFGGGRRSCPGQNLGLLNVKLTLAMMLSKYRFVAKDPVQKLTGKSLVVYSVDPVCTEVFVERILS
jgi:cytochrome P450